MPVLILSCSVRRTAIDLPPMTREFSFGRVKRRMLGVRVELPARDIDERAVRESNELVPIRSDGARCGILRLDPMPADPDRPRLDALGTELLHYLVGRDPALIVRLALVGESWVTSQEIVDVLEHGREG